MLFNGGCTGELISPEELLRDQPPLRLRRHGAIRPSNTYLTHGFWARDRSGRAAQRGAVGAAAGAHGRGDHDRLAAGETAEKHLARPPGTLPHGDRADVLR